MKTKKQTYKKFGKIYLGYVQFLESDGEYEVLHIAFLGYPGKRNYRSDYTVKCIDESGNVFTAPMKRIYPSYPTPTQRKAQYIEDLKYELESEYDMNEAKSILKNKKTEVSGAEARVNYILSKRDNMRKKLEELTKNEGSEK